MLNDALIAMMGGVVFFGNFLTPEDGSSPDMTASNAQPNSTYKITLENGSEFSCASDQLILMAMEQVGASGIDIGCRGGGCGACRIEIVHGDYDTLPMSKKHVSEDDVASGIALACRVAPKSDMLIRIAPQKIVQADAAVTVTVNA